MKKVFYSVAILVCALVLASCSKDDDNHGMDNVEPNIETRASELGFADVEAYKLSVAEQHAAGDHVNCDTLADGTHQACSSEGHSGENHDGTDHKGTDHGTDNTDGNSHGGKENHNGDNKDHKGTH